MVAVLAVLGVVGGVAWGIADVVALRHAGAAPERVSGSRVAASILPASPQTPPRGRVVQVHQSLHGLHNACRLPAAARDRDVVRRDLAVFESFAEDFPRGGFTIDDESGSTLALLIAVRAELEWCEPVLLPRVESLIPPRYREPSG